MQNEPNYSCGWWWLMRQLAYLQTSARTVPSLQVMGTSWGAEVTDTGQLWGGLSCIYLQSAHRAPKMFGIHSTCPSRALALKFPGQTLHQVLTVPLLAPFLPKSPPSVTAPAFPDASSCTIWALFKAKRLILGHLIHSILALKSLCCCNLMTRAWSQVNPPLLLLRKKSLKISAPSFFKRVISFPLCINSVLRAHPYRPDLLSASRRFRFVWGSASSCASSLQDGC